MNTYRSRYENIGIQIHTLSLFHTQAINTSHHPTFLLRSANGLQSPPRQTRHRLEHGLLEETWLRFKDPKMTAVVASIHLCTTALMSSAGGSQQKPGAKRISSCKTGRYGCGRIGGSSDRVSFIGFGVTYILGYACDDYLSGHRRALVIGHQNGRFVVSPSLDPVQVKSSIYAEYRYIVLLRVGTQEKKTRGGKRQVATYMIRRWPMAGLRLARQRK